MYDGMKLHRALVADSSSITGDIYVRIPSLLGPNEIVSVSKVGRSAVNGTWVVPSPNTQVVVAVDDMSLTSVYLVYTSTDNSVPVVYGNVTTLGGSVGSLNTSVSSLNTSVGSLGTRVTALENVTPYTAATPLQIVSVVSSPYVVQASDIGKLLQVNSTGAVTISIPATGFATGVELYVASINTGKVTIGGAATINSSGGIKTLTGQYSTAALVRLSSYWLLFGDLG